VVKAGAICHQKRKSMRKNYSGKFKTKVVVDAMKEQDTVAELSSKPAWPDPKYPGHPRI